LEMPFDGSLQYTEVQNCLANAMIEIKNRWGWRSLLGLQTCATLAIDQQRQYSWDVRDAAVEALGNAVGVRSRHEIQSWHDRPWRRRSTVVKAFNRAILL
jgi:hypothetical protein